MDNIKCKYILQPEFYMDFACVGGSCENTCCTSWRIDWDAASVEKLRKADCSEKLRDLVNYSFIENGNNYTIKLDEQKRCPFLTEDNFCMIQRELGAEYLSIVCTIYPRVSTINNNIAARTCNCSCCAALDLIMENKNAMKLGRYTPKSSNLNLAPKYYLSKEKLAKHPELGYGMEIFEFLYSIISDTDYDVETAIVIGALAAQKLTSVIESKKYQLIPEMIKELKVQLKKPDIVNSVKNIKPVPEIRLGVQARLYDEITRTNIITDLIKHGRFTEKTYQDGYSKFNEYLSENNHVLRNILLNFMFELGIPYTHDERSVFENYSYFAAVAASVKLMAAVSFVSNDDDSIKKFRLGIAKMSRSLSHSEEIRINLLEILKEYNCKTPAYLAVIIK